MTRLKRLHSVEEFVRERHEAQEQHKGMKQMATLSDEELGVRIAALEATRDPAYEAQLADMTVDDLSREVGRLCGW